jgi:hypothetical protein
MLPGETDSVALGERTTLPGNTSPETRVGGWGQEGPPGKEEAAQALIRAVAALRDVLACFPQAAPVKAEEEKPAEDKEKEKKKPEEQVPLFWRMCSAALLSITAMLAVTLYMQLSNSLSSTRNELILLREHQTDMLKKDEYNKRNIAIASSIKELQANSDAALGAWRDRANRLEGQIKASQDAAQQRNDRRETELRRLHERLAALEAESRLARGAEKDDKPRPPPSKRPTGRGGP